MFEKQRVDRLRRGTSDERDDDAARYLIDELAKCCVRDPDGEKFDVRYSELMSALEATVGRLGIPYQPQYRSLRAWGRDNDLTWTPRFQHMAVAKRQFEPVINALDFPNEAELLVPVDDEPTGWAKVDEEERHIRRDFANATSATDLAGVARTCREAFVSLADASYDEKRHGPLPAAESGAGGGTVRSRLTAVIQSEAAGKKAAELRAIATNALNYANSRQHSKTTTRDQAADVADATIFVIRMVRRLTQRS